MSAALGAVRSATGSAIANVSSRFPRAAFRKAPRGHGSWRRGVAEIKEWEVATKRYRSIDEVKTQIQAALDAKPEVFSSISDKGLKFDQFDKLVDELCPSVGTRERRSLFMSMDLSGDGWIQATELFSDVVLRIIRTRFENPQILHPVQGSYASLPRPPFVHDPKQMAVVDTLSAIYNEVVADWEAGQDYSVARPKLAPSNPSRTSSAWWGSLHGARELEDDTGVVKSAPYTIPAYHARKGLYLVGTSGSGKTALLNVFFRSLPDDFPVVRLHWHEFTRDGFKYMHDVTFKKQKGRSTFDMIADKVAGHCRVFLLDELNVTHISEAILFKELLRAMWLRGITVITTSNYRIDDLYYDGFNRSLFVDFLPELHERCPEFDMSCEIDYRTVGVTDSGYFLVGLTPENKQLHESKFVALARDVQRDIQLPVPFEARSIHVPVASTDEDIARFEFKDLCGKPLGRADYSLIATRYHTLFVDNIPKLKVDDGMEFKRFVSLIDMIYDKKVSLHTLAEVPCDQIYHTTDDMHMDERFAWRRCQSMLTEMQSTKYQKMAWLMRRHLVQDTAVHL